MKWFVPILAIAACSKGPPTIDPSPKNVESPDQNPPVPPKPDAPPPDGPDPAENPQFFAPRDIQPPPTRNVAPVKTTAVIPDAKLRTLAAIDVPEWKHDPPGIIDHVGIFHYRTTTHPTVSVDVVITPCVIEGKQKCFGMELAKWQAPENVEALDEAFPTAARGKAAKAETGTVAIAQDSSAIFEYHLATIASTDIRGRAHTQIAHAYTLHYTDGINRIRVTAFYDDSMPKEPAATSGSGSGSGSGSSGSSGSGSAARSGSGAGSAASGSAKLDPLDTVAAAVTKDQLLATARGYFELFTSQWQ